MKKIVDLPYEKILVLGLAKSGTAAAKLLKQSGKKVRVNDLKAKPTDLAVRQLEEMGVEVVTGGHPISVLDDVDLLVKNPGIPYDNVIVAEAEQRELPIITEIELASRLVDGHLIGITGSNGKTTTTTLIYEMLKNSNQQAKIAGNIGNVATEVAQSLEQNESMVIELSSFQLLGVETFRPDIAVLLNLFESHLDYHQSFENYKRAKSNIFKNQTEHDFIVYNADDEQVVDTVQEAPSIKVPFSITKRCIDGAWCNNTSIYFKEEEIILLSDIVLVGKHNLENILAAVCAAKLNGVTTAAIQDVLKTFTGVKHRLQFVDNRNGRLFYNDSKATNILATSKALAAFEHPIILLAGGLDRGNSFDDLIPHLEKVKAMVVFGETAQKLAKTAHQAGIDTVKFVDNVKHAVQKAYELSSEQDIILLSPACASWDQYATFEERGDMFTEAVHTLE
ncbi:UDP-N-acetylmuramoyl-L-alanine--D-glutamate ligase [Aquibacillus sp. 3ASR75-11]|uniref:UDP-N-acetylmuramoylalanine--D-glutamate ligase n=1 Tax=Terrihalobacillus insolitus TaxID=2950438 RepID=A0A9X3WTP1_9BACI|nr:UDP-N-acetylmuramoyl-L-alanine--D-glutamate ligase [Terrihalobacillus insolitus]MDC3412833.1 UDP-N-acetylmuramoyl-L-alanine--D-glutamate ligase [Terrihalobacillus insolitus]MDC3423691.1 UDP-N-acetylmuramoyl-L-alanine--D-glutamate ligase [Terrihalobacillus insolitus]